jgi:hypothetical protein
MTALDPREAVAELEALVAGLRDRHAAFEHAARGWSDASRDDKRRLRHEREVFFLRIKITLARLGEVARVLHLEKLPFAGRIEALEQLLLSGPFRQVRSSGEPARLNGKPDSAEASWGTDSDSGAVAAP